MADTTGTTASENLVRSRLFNSMRAVVPDLTGDKAMDLADEMMRELFEDPALVHVVLEVLQKHVGEEPQEWLTAYVALLSQASQFVRRAKLLATDISLPRTLQSEFKALETAIADIERLRDL